MYTLFYNFEEDTFILSRVNFFNDFYEDLEFGYFNRTGEMLVCLLIYNIYTRSFDITFSYWLWRETIKLKYYRVLK